MRRRDPLPPDVDAKSRCRLPLPDRDTLDEAGKLAYDRAGGPGIIAGLQGPAGIQFMGTYANTAAMLAVVDMQIPDGRPAPLPIS